MFVECGYWGGLVFFIFGFSFVINSFGVFVLLVSFYEQEIGVLRYERFCLVEQMVQGRIGVEFQLISKLCFAFLGEGVGIENEVLFSRRERQFFQQQSYFFVGRVRKILSDIESRIRFKLNFSFLDGCLEIFYFGGNVRGLQQVLVLYCKGRK